MEKIGIKNVRNRLHIDKKEKQLNVTPQAHMNEELHDEN